jgi:hypothetical protein
MIVGQNTIASRSKAMSPATMAYLGISLTSLRILE